MPLRKLWKSILGVSDQSPPERDTDLETVQAVEPTVQSPSTNRISRSRRPSVSRDDKRICKKIQSLKPGSVLEVGIGDGSRAISIVASLTHQGHSTPVNYLAIDSFEMGSSGISLRDFHKQLREFPAKAHLVPMSIEAGLDRVVSTFGQVDVIVWSADTAPTKSQQSRLHRLCKPSTVVLGKQENGWIEISVAPPELETSIRRAA